MPLARRSGLPGIPELVAKMKGGADALTAEVVEAMTTNETFFFRDKIPFDHLRETVIPALVQARAARRALRIWCAASSTGQEPYSIAMCLKEAGSLLSGWRTEIVATDLSQGGAGKSQGRHLQPVRGAARLADPVAGEVFHARTESCGSSMPTSAAWCSIASSICCRISPILASFDIIFCRNVLIYFDQNTKTDIFDGWSRMLEPDGVLALGAAESVVGITNTFKPYPERRGLYRPNVAPATRGGVTSIGLRAVASAAR